ncbi:MAG: ATP-dependent serine protease, partial [Bacteroidales bacterium]
MKRRALSVADIEKYKPKVMPFEGEFQASFGQPEMSGSWIIYGDPKNGKTGLALQLCKYLCQYGRVAYDTLEEGLSLSFKSAVLRAGMQGLGGKFAILDKEPIADLRERLKKHKSPDIVVIDSLQYSGLKYSEYKALKDEF